MVPEHDLFNELEAARKELRLLRTENEELKKKVADFESNIGDPGRVHDCEVQGDHSGCLKPSVDFNFITRHVNSGGYFVN